jgi:hypothetical protein
MMSKPLFLVGAERSGSTLLRLMLDGHPLLAWNEEFEYAVDLMSDDSEPRCFPDVERYVRYLELDRIFLFSNFTIDKSLGYRELVNSFLLQKMQRDGKQLIGCTVHRHFDRLLKIWPDARFIHLLRDGRDVARSVIDMGWAGNVYTGCDRWIEAENLFSTLVRRMEPERYMTVLFEDLIMHPTRELTRICDFCNVPYDPAMLDYPTRSTYGAPDPKIMRSWKRKMSMADVQLIESRIGAMLIERGYELSGFPAVSVTAADERRLRRSDFWSRLKFRVKQNGPVLFASDYLTRRLGLSSWQKIVRLKLNRLEQARLR